MTPVSCSRDLSQAQQQRTFCQHQKLTALNGGTILPKSSHRKTLQHTGFLLKGEVCWHLVFHEASIAIGSSYASALAQHQVLLASGVQAQQADKAPMQMWA